MNYELETKLINLVLELLKKESDKLLIKIYCLQAYNEGCAYCNVEELPEESLPNLAFLVIANLKSENNDIIKSISEGGRNVNFGNLTGLEMREKALKGLNKWKRVRSV